MVKLVLFRPFQSKTKPSRLEYIVLVIKGLFHGYGGPHAAFFAKEEFKRSMPGRILISLIDEKSLDYLFKLEKAYKMRQGHK